MTSVRKKFLSAVLSLTMILTMFNQINLRDFYAQEKENKWLTKLDVLEVSKQESKIKVEIGYNNLESLGKNEKLEGLNFYIVSNDTKIDIPLTQNSKEKLSQISNQNSIIQLDIDISNIDLDSLTNPSLNVYPIIRQEKEVDITDLLKYKNQEFVISLQDEDFIQLEQIYNISSIDKKQKLSRLLLQEDTNLELNQDNFKFEVEKYISKKIYQDPKNQELNQKLEEIIQKNKEQEQNQDISISLKEITNLQEEVRDLLSKIKKEQIQQLIQLLEKEQNIPMDNVSDEYNSQAETTTPSTNQNNNTIQEENTAVEEIQEENISVEEVQNKEEDENQDDLQENQNSSIQENTDINENTDNIKIKKESDTNSTQEDEIKEEENKIQENLNKGFKEVSTIGYINISNPKLNSASQADDNTVTAYTTVSGTTNTLSSQLNLNKKEVNLNVSVSKNEIYSYNDGTFTVLVDSSQITKDLKSPYIKFTVPTEFLTKNSLKVAQGGDKTIFSPDKSHETVENSDGTTTYKIYLNDIKAKTNDIKSIPINFGVIPRHTPEGYKMIPEVELFDKDDNSVAKWEKNDSVFVKIKYEKVKLFKAIAEKTQINYKYIDNKELPIKDTNAYVVYGGELGQDKKIKKAENIEFYYGLSTNISVANPYVKEKYKNIRPIPAQYNQSYGNGTKQTRFLERLVITETLPTYENTDGKIVRAVFDQALNPGWTLSQDGTKVSKEFKKYKKNNIDVGADVNMYDNAKLVLSFPEFPGITDNPDGTYNSTPNDIITSRARVDLFPINASPEEVDIYDEDELPFMLNGNLLGGSGIFSKRAISKHTYIDIGGMHYNSANYKISVANPYKYPMKNISIIDKEFDERLFVKNIFWDISELSKDSQNKLRDAFEGVYGILEDGREELVAGFKDITKYQPSNISIIEKETQENILKNVEKIRNNEITDINNIPKINAKYKSIKFKMKDSFQLEKGEKIIFDVNMGFLEPYKLKAEPSDTDIKNALTNKATLNVNFLDKDRTVTSQDSIRLKYKTYSNQVEMQTVYNSTGSIGEKIELYSKLELSNMPKGVRYNNPYLVVLIPKGLDLIDGKDRHGTTIINNYKNETFSKLLREPYKEEDKINNKINLKAIEIDNFDEDGNRALIYPLRDFEGYESPFMWHITVNAKINEEAINSQFAKDYDNRANVFFYADNLQDIMEKSNIDKSDKNYKEDSFNIIAKLKEKNLVSTDKIQEKMLTNSVQFKANSATQTKSEKRIKLKNSNNWTESIETNYEEEFEYKLTVKNLNLAKKAIKKLVIYDILPYSGYIDSEFSNQMIDKITVKKGKTKNPKDYDVYYYVGEQTPSNDVSDYVENSNIKPGISNWEQNPQDYTKVKAILIIMKADKTMDAGDIQDFILPMKAPKFDQNVDLTNKIANNKFIVSLDNAQFGEINKVTNIIKPKIGTVVAKYIVVDESGNPVKDLDETTKKLFEDATETYKDIIGKDYNTQKKEFDRYEFVGIDETKDNPTGQFEEREKEVVYKYTAKKGTVVAKYIVVDESGNPVTNLDETTKKLFEDATETYKDIIGKDYNTQKKEFDKYEFVGIDETKDNPTGQFEEREKEVVYKYIIKKGTVIARYIEVDEKGKPTGKILQEPITITGDLDTNYETEQKSFDKYEFVGIDETKDNPTGQFEEREKEVVYKYTAEKVDNPPKGGGSPSNPPKKEDNPPKSEENKPKTPDKPEEKEQTPPVKPENPTSSSDDTPTNETEKEKPKEEEPKKEEQKDNIDKNEEPKKETPKIEQPPTDDSEKPIIPTSLEPKNEEQTPPVEPNNNTPSTETQAPTPIYDRPSINPPTNTPFVPQRIINIPPNRSEEMVVMVIDENGTPLGKAVINPQDNSYTFIDDERTPMGTAKLHNDNVLEILDKNVPKAFPKTGQEGNTLYYLLGLGMISLAIGLKKKRNKK